MPAETKILVALRPTLVQQLFSDEHLQALSKLGALTFQPGEDRSAPGSSPSRSAPMTL